MARSRQSQALSLLVLVFGSVAIARAQTQKSYINVYGQVKCYAEALVKPESTEQLAAAVKQFADAAKQSGKPLKIRTSRSVFHSTASFACPYTSDLIPAAPDSSSAAPSYVAVMTEGFNKVLKVDKAAYTVTVQAGLKVLDLLRWADKNGMATEPGAPTNYAELTIGGVISANGHGTGSNVTSSMGDIALEFTWVDASGGIHTSSRDSPEGHALAGGVGLVGIITEVKLQMTPPSNTQAVSINLLPDSNIAADVTKLLQTTKNIALMWRPDLKKYNAFLMSKTEEPAKKGDHAGLVFPLPTPISNAFQLVLLPLQADIHDTAVSRALNPLNCLTALTSIAYLRWASKSILPQVPGAPLDMAVAQIKAVGSTNVMMGGGCEPFCMWNSELTVDDIEFAIELEDFPAWVEDVKKIFQKDLSEDGKAQDRCLPFGGYVFLRFGKANNDYSSVTSGMKNPIYVELTNARSRKLPGVPAKYAFVQDAMEQLTLCKYKGRPHWGKNSDRAWGHPECSVRDALPNFDKQLEMQAKYDPNKVFESILMSRFIAKQPNLYSPQCDLKRSCYCTQDSHCAQGFACVPLASFPQFKVCKPSPMLPKLLG
uniref:FAD-binding PCMH-type domain-containing protein n=1 Tax=Tetradesmus obliquus TaxID=3088 RepID=A0A383WHX7_TETOB